MPVQDPAASKLGVDFCGIRLANPFVLAASPCTDDLDMVRRAFDAGWAGAVLKTTSVPGTRVSLAYPMMSGSDFAGRRLAGMGNIDLISEHHADVVEKRVSSLKSEFPDRAVVASIMAGSRQDWQSLVKRLETAGADAIECSFSCPQGTIGSKPGRMLGQDAALAAMVAGWVKEAANRIPVVIKITPQVADIAEVARALESAGADAICAANSIPSLAGIDVNTAIPNPPVAGLSTYSGYSGPAIKPLTLRTIAEIAKAVRLPITATGGPATWRDAVEMMMVGASSVQFCTAVMHHGFRIIEDLVEGLEIFMETKGYSATSDFRGAALANIASHDDLKRGVRVRARVDRELCVGCGGCARACADGGHQAARIGDDGKAGVDEERCVGCALCEKMCPSGAIAVVQAPE